MNIIDLTGLLPRHPTKLYYKRPIEAIRRIVVHHTAGPATQSPLDLARYHIDVKGWPGIGYHMLVDAAGLIYKTLSAATIAACVEKGNTPSYCICMIGNFTAAPPPAAQWRAAVWVARLCVLAYDAEDGIVGHGELMATACPGAKVDMVRFRQDAAASG